MRYVCSGIPYEIAVRDLAVLLWRLALSRGIDDNPVLSNMRNGGKV